MKTGLVIGVLVLAVIASGQSSLTLTPGSTLASCAPPSPKALIFCNVAGDPANPDGVYVTANGAPYFRVDNAAAGSPSASGVASFKGRAGAVVPMQGDYKYAQLALRPTKLTCTTASITAGKFNGTGCTFF